jgi:hypothetical protein
MQMAYGIKLNPKRMKKLEKDYQIQKAKEQEETVELRVSVKITHISSEEIN